MPPISPATHLSPRSSRRVIARAFALPLVLSLLLVTLSACTITFPSFPMRLGQGDDAGNQPVDADELHDFEDLLTSAFASGDYDALASMSADPFRLAEWEQSSRIIERDELESNLETIYLGPASAPMVDVAVDLDVIEAIVGSDPRTLWGEDLPVLSVLLASGLNEDDAGEALLAIAANAETGAPEWAGMLLASEGFPASPLDTTDEGGELESTPSSVNTLSILTSVEVLGAPNPEAAVVGILNAGRVVEVLGRSADTDYFHIACPASIASQCWIENDPDAFETLEVPVAPADEATATPVAEATSTPANTPVAQATTILPERIEFVGGPVSQTRTGTVRAEAPVTYLVHLGAGQGFTVDLVSAGNAANFSVTGASNGQPYKPLDSSARLWTFTVPVTQDHIVTVFSETETDYILTLLAPPIAQRQPTATPLPTNTPAPVPTEMADQPTPVDSSPQRIRFGPGETSAQRNGVIRVDERQRYVLRVLAGQTLSVDLFSGGNLANFSITGVDDGQPYKRLENEDRGFAFVVPTTQDYLISIATLAAADYTLTVVVPAAITATATPLPTPLPAPDPVDNAVRLRFASGETRTAVTEIVNAYDTDAYVLRALAGQSMFVTIQSPESITRFAVQGEDGSTLKSFDSAQAWSGVLPATQDYFVLVDNPRGVRVRYTMSVGFSPLAGDAPAPTPTPPIDYVPPAPPQRINFPPGAVSASIEGYIFPGELQSYVLGASAGQRMEVVITAPLNEVGLSIVGADGTPYKRSSVGTSSFAFILPTTQDYYVEAVALGNASPYTLSVTITD